MYTCWEKNKKNNLRESGILESNKWENKKLITIDVGYTLYSDLN